MMMIDMENRWAYKGSITTPPCRRFVFWNVLHTIYPIKQKHLDLFLKQLERGDEGKLAQRGNWRKVNRVDLHNVISVIDKIPIKAFSQDTYNINVNIYNQGSQQSSCT